MSQVREILVEARGLIEKGWTQGTLARNSKGREVEIYSVDAVCWCTIGAVRLASWNFEFIGDRALDLIEDEIGKGWVLPAWNDAPERKKEEVLSAFDRAIESLNISGA